MPDPIASHTEKINILKDHFQKQTGCDVEDEWKIDLHCHRFYFRAGEKGGWKYILDVSQDDLEGQDVPEIITGLDAGKWQSILEEYSGKRVPCFKDKKFGAPATFCEWPT